MTFEPSRCTLMLSKSPRQHPFGRRQKQFSVTSCGELYRVATEWLLELLMDASRYRPDLPEEILNLKLVRFGKVLKDDKRCECLHEKAYILIPNTPPPRREMLLKSIPDSSILDDMMERSSHNSHLIEAYKMVADGFADPVRNLNIIENSMSYPIWQRKLVMENRQGFCDPYQVWEALKKVLKYHDEMYTGYLGAIKKFKEVLDMARRGQKPDDILSMFLSLEA